jgi:hypothetical protein
MSVNKCRRKPTCFRVCGSLCATGSVLIERVLSWLVTVKVDEPSLSVARCVARCLAVVLGWMHTPVALS